ncbi:MAG: CapA family protein [Coriobacteriales bacterium]|jgi:poly-gamma-glutamate synthesis protein (capsule biosynthesis protein)|nr:CapA family protein [Coriobacteriales bacterium]
MPGWAAGCGPGDAEVRAGASGMDAAGHGGLAADGLTDAKPEPAPPARTALLTFAGDTLLGDDWGSGSFQAVVDSEGYGWCLGAVQPLFAADDLTIVNLECPLTDSTDPYPKGENKEDEPKLYYWYRGPSRNAAILSEGDVEIVNIANNHMGDFGYGGRADTMASLDAAGIEYFGYDIRLLREVNGITIGFFGLAFDPNYDHIAEAVNWLRDNGADVVIASFHEGDDYATYTTNANQIAAAHNAIDAGADAVIEHHPHRIQGYELYQGCPVFYSLGNFCYGGSGFIEDMDTMVVQLRITETANGWDVAYEILPASISSSTGRNDYRPRILEGEEGQAVLARIEEAAAGGY